MTNLPVWAIDEGYGWVKWAKGLGERDMGSFLSVVGTPDEAMFDLGLTGEPTVLTQPAVMIGVSAARQSTFVAAGRRDQDWVKSDEWYTLFLFALTELTRAINITPSLVVGLPVSYYLQDRDWVRDRLTGMHTVQRKGRSLQTIHIGDCRVVPQGWGVMLDYIIGDDGKIDPSMLHLTGATVDVGSCTTNILKINSLKDIPSKSRSLPMGAMDITGALQRYMDDRCPGLQPRQYELARAAVARQIRYDGAAVDLGDAMDEICKPMALQVATAAKEKWGDGHDLDVILIAGGGGLLLGPYLREYFPRAIVMPDGITSQVRGMYKLGKYT